MSKNKRTSKYTGVSWSIRHQVWAAKVSEDGVAYDCGCHVDEREAAKLRDLKIIAMGLKKPLQILKKC